jgi:hypothetical protein
MLNDFYAIRVSAKTITALKNAGVARDNIRRERDGVAVYGRFVYPRWVYVATVGYAETNGNPDAIADQWRNKGVNVSVNYICRD